MEKSQDASIEMRVVCAVCARELKWQVPNIDYGDNRIKDDAVIKDYCDRCNFLRDLLYGEEEIVAYAAALILRSRRKAGEVVWSDYRI